MDQYRYGYQGSEINPELEGSYTTFHRQLDTRIGRWMGVDPVVRADQSPYSSMDDSPIRFTDPKGDHPIIPIILALGKNAAINMAVQGTIHVGFDLYNKGWDDFSMTESLGKIDVGDAMIFSGGLGGVKAAAGKVALASALDLTLNGDVAVVGVEATERATGINLPLSNKSFSSVGIDVMANSIGVGLGKGTNSLIEKKVMAPLSEARMGMNALAPELRNKGLMGENGSLLSATELNPLVRYANRKLYSQAQRFAMRIDNSSNYEEVNSTLSLGITSIALGSGSAIGKTLSKEMLSNNSSSGSSSSLTGSKPTNPEQLWQSVRSLRSSPSTSSSSSNRSKSPNSEQLWQSIRSL